MLTFCNDQYKLLRRIGAGSFGSIFISVAMPKQSITSPFAHALNQNNLSGLEQQIMHEPLPGMVQGDNSNNNNNNNGNPATADPSTAAAALAGSFSMNTSTPKALREREGSFKHSGSIAAVAGGSDVGAAVAAVDRSTNSAPASPKIVSTPVSGHASGVTVAGNIGFMASSNLTASAGGVPVPATASTSNISNSLVPRQVYFVTKLEQLPKDVTITSTTSPAAIQQLINSSRSHLTREYKFYRYMHSCVANLQGIPNVYEYGAEGQFRYLVMDYLGPSLDSLFRAKGKRFTPLTVIRIAQQMIARMELTHALGIVHRDVKPENFCMGVGDKSHVVYLIDFGLAKMYLNRDTGNHVEVATGRKLAGTARYCSVWTHEGISQSRRDDLEGVWFTLLYFARGSFPWDQGPADVSVEQYIFNHKKTLSPEMLCRSVPDPLKAFLVNFITYVRSLEFADTPSYDLLRSYCNDALEQIDMSPNIESLTDFCWFRKRTEASPGSGASSSSGGAEGLLDGALADRSFSAISLQGNTAQSSMMGGNSSMTQGAGRGGGAQSSTGSQSGFLSPQSRRLPPPGSAAAAAAATGSTARQGLPHVQLAPGQQQQQQQQQPLSPQQQQHQPMFPSAGGASPGRSSLASGKGGAADLSAAL